MEAHLEIRAGICGFRTTVWATGNDEQAVTFAVESDCEKIQKLVQRLKAHEPIDSLAEVDPASQSVILTTARECLKGCCAGCVIPVGLFKGMQVAAGLALPSDIAVRITTTD